MKTCTRCSRDLDSSFFHRDSKSNDGLTSRCKDCQNAQRRQSRKGKDAIEKLRKAQEGQDKQQLRRKAAAEWLWTS
jgi:hypothetical protein